MIELPEKSLAVIHVKEPELYFGHGQTSDHPKDGLFLYGPHSAPNRTKEISVGAIGTREGLRFLRRWAIRLGGFVEVPPPGPREKEHRLHLSNFPGLEETFGITFNPLDFVQRKIDFKVLDEATRTLNQHEAVRSAVDLYVHEIEDYDRNEERNIDIWLFILPELVFERCKPQSRRSGLSLVKGEFEKSQKSKRFYHSWRTLSTKAMRTSSMMSRTFIDKPKRGCSNSDTSRSWCVKRRLPPRTF